MWVNIPNSSQRIFWDWFYWFSRVWPSWWRFFFTTLNDGSMGWKVNIYLVIFPIFPITHDKCRYLPHGSVMGTIGSQYMAYVGGIPHPRCQWNIIICSFLWSAPYKPSPQVHIDLRDLPGMCSETPTKGPLPPSACQQVFVQPSWFASEMVPNWAPILVRKILPTQPSGVLGDGGWTLNHGVWDEMGWVLCLFFWCVFYLGFLPKKRKGS